jgi:hypothetical protein
MNRTLARHSLAAATAAKGGPAHTFAATTLLRYVMWDLASDFGITATNPQRDSYGDANVRSFPQDSNLEDPPTFTRLGTYTTTRFGVRA